MPESTQYKSFIHVVKQRRYRKRSFVVWQEESVNLQESSRGLKLLLFRLAHILTTCPLRLWTEGDLFDRSFHQTNLWLVPQTLQHTGPISPKRDSDTTQGPGHYCHIHRVVCTFCRIRAHIRHYNSAREDITKP